MDSLFGSRQNVYPSFVMETGQPLIKNFSVNDSDTSSSITDAVEKEYEKSEIMQQDNLLAETVDTSVGIYYGEHLSTPAFPSKRKTTDVPISSELKSLSASAFTNQSSSDISSKIVNEKKMRKRDFSYTFSECKANELALEKAKLDWEKERFNEEMKHVSKREIIKALIDQNKSPDEIKSFLEALFD